MTRPGDTSPPTSAFTVALAAVTLAKQATTGDMVSMFVAFGLLGLGICLLVVLLLVARKAVLDRQHFQFDEGFSLADLRSLRDDGKITESEYARAKASVVARGRLKAAADVTQSKERDIKALAEPPDDADILENPQGDSDNDASIG